MEKLELEKVVKELVNPISLIVAMAENRVIGKAGSMPWHLPQELKYFRSRTLNKPIIMGRKTFNSIGKPLKNRANIVLTKNLNVHLDEQLPEDTSLHFCTDLAEGLKLADDLATQLGVYEIVIIGGGSIYQQILPFSHKIYLSKIDMQVQDADTFFPELGDNWQIVSNKQEEGFVAQVLENKALPTKINEQEELNHLTEELELKVEKVLNRVGKQYMENNAKQQENSQANEQEPKKLAKLDEVLLSWQEKYPQTFFAEEGKPLKIGIHEDLIASGDFSENYVKRALAKYTKRPRYLRNMKEGAKRVDLNGETEVLVTAEDEAAAKKALSDLRKRNKEKQKLQQKQNAGKQNNQKNAANKGKNFKGKSDFKNTNKVYKKNTDKKFVSKDKPVQQNSEDAARMQSKLQKLVEKNSKYS